MKSALKNFLKNRVPKSVIRALYPHTLRGMCQPAPIVYPVST